MRGAVVMKSPIFIAIAGGSGAGKSTLAHAFLDAHPSDVAVIYLDDYRKEKELLSRVNGFINWDHPDTIYWDQLAQDMADLQCGREVVIHKKNNHFDVHAIDSAETSKTIVPSKFILLDGYLALWHPEIRGFFDFSLFLDISHELRIARRKKFNDEEDGRAYFEHILIPMHNQFVEPTKQYADMIFDAETMSQDHVLSQFTKTVIEQYE